MSDEERIIEQAKFRVTKLVKEYGVSLTFSGYDKVVAEIINSINWYKEFANESNHSFARSQAIGFLKWYKGLSYHKKHGKPITMMYSIFLDHQAKQKEGGKI